MAQGPGPPQRPHIPGAAAEGLVEAPAELIAKTDIDRVVCVD